jgi:prepilin-type N-terminal cleavage/methylation domain-containing protein
MPTPSLYEKTKKKAIICLEAARNGVGSVVMANVTNSTLGLGRQSANRSQRGFSLVELMCVVAIMSLLASVSWPAIVGLVSGNRLTNNAYELSGLMQAARTTAMTQHTYVWLGFYSYTTAEGSPAVMVASVVGNSGLSTDLPGNCRLSTKPVILKNVKLAPFATPPNYAALPGLAVPDNVIVFDAGSQTSSFQWNVPGNSSATFSDVIVFGPDGQASLPLTSTGALQLVQCVGVGLNAAPNSTSNLHSVAVQVHGLSGQVSVFQQ